MKVGEPMTERRAERLIESLDSLLNAAWRLGEDITSANRPDGEGDRLSDVLERLEAWMRDAEKELEEIEVYKLHLWEKRESMADQDA